MSDVHYGRPGYRMRTLYFYSIDDQPVNTVSEMRDLGVIVDSSLNVHHQSCQIS